MDAMVTRLCTDGSLRVREETCKDGRLVKRRKVRGKNFFRGYPQFRMKYERWLRDVDIDK